MGIGNVLRHEYHRVSDTLIWNVVQEYLAPLRAAIAAIEAEITMIAKLHGEGRPRSRSGEGLPGLIESRREPIFTAPFQSGQSKPRKAKEDHRPSRQFGNGLRATLGRSRGRRRVV
jgi:hypothetical protein